MLAAVGDLPAAELPVDTIERVARSIGMALEILVLRHKIRSMGRLTAGGGAN